MMKSQRSTQRCKTTTCVSVREKRKKEPAELFLKKKKTQNMEKRFKNCTT